MCLLVEFNTVCLMYSERGGNLRERVEKERAKEREREIERERERERESEGDRRV